MYRSTTFGLFLSWYTWVVSTFLAIRNSAAVNICGKAFGYLFSILVYAQEYAESWYFYVQLCQATPNSLPHQCTSLYPNLRCMRVWISSCLCQLVLYLDLSSSWMQSVYLLVDLIGSRGLPLSNTKNNLVFTYDRLPGRSDLKVNCAWSGDQWIWWRNCHWVFSSMPLLSQCHSTFCTLGLVLRWPCILRVRKQPRVAKLCLRWCGY